MIDEPDVSIDELLEIIPGPRLSHRRHRDAAAAGIRRGYMTGRSTITVRARTRIEEHGKNRFRIVVNEIPFQQARDRIEERIAELVNDDRIKGISDIRNESDLKEPVRLILELKRDADPEIVLNQLYQFSPLQDSFSIIFLALVDGKPRMLSIKEMLQEFIRHRVTVIRRRTQFLLNRARQRKHTVEGLLLAHANIDEVIRVIRDSVDNRRGQSAIDGNPLPGAARLPGPWAKPVCRVQSRSGRGRGLHAHRRPSRRHLADDARPVGESGARKARRRTSRICSTRSPNICGILSDEKNIRDLIRAELVELKKKHAEPRRTEISGEELGTVDLEDLIPEETMVVTISHNGYIKRTAASTYRAQRRGGKGLTGAKTEDEDPIAHLFAASTHDYLLFFTNRGKVYWQKVYDLPQLSRESRGRAVVNLLNFAPKASAWPIAGQCAIFSPARS